MEIPVQLLFNSSVRVEFQGARVTSDGGLLVREPDERLGLSALMERHMIDSRRISSKSERKFRLN
jgi:hypothetical protein